MEKLKLFNRPLRLADVNKMIETINRLIDKVDKKVEIQDIQITKYVKDFKFFKWRTETLPYENSFVLSSVEDLQRLFNDFDIWVDMSWALSEMINKWIIVNLSIFIWEDLTEKDKKQEIMFETIETKPIEKVEKKKTVKKKTTKKKK